MEGEEAKHVYEYCQRPSYDVLPIDGVDAIPICIKPESDPDFKKIMIIKNYRIPVKNFVIEFPGGLFDEGDTALGCALRELKEECGYVAEENPQHLNLP